MSVALSSLHHKLKLSKRTTFFGLRLWVLVVTSIAALFLLFFSIICFFFFSRRSRRPRKVRLDSLKHSDFTNCHSVSYKSSLDRRLLSRTGSDMEMGIWTPDRPALFAGQWSVRAGGVKIDLRERMQCKHGYSIREIEAATNCFADENVIGSGDHGIVYRGVMFDGTRVAVKKLLCGRGNGEDFLAQAEAIGLARHRNLVNLLGYCIEGANRMLVYQYVDNGNLKDWLHGYIGHVSPLTWTIRMNIIQSVAKCLAYLHEDIEPKIIHGHVKSGNILLDHQWNPKISDLGVAKVLGSEWTQVATSSLGMFGYTAPEYAHTGKFDEKTDVYSFGILLMEIITGKSPVGCHSIGTEEEVYLIDWLKSMVSRRHIEYVLDPMVPDPPSMKELKRTVLIALRCVDPDTENRPRMGEVIQMFEPRDLLLSGEFCVKHKTLHCKVDSQTGGE